ncbi:MAG: hypothetical protein WDZ51_05055 [Pirellulaceae bacterium]
MFPEEAEDSRELKSVDRISPPQTPHQTPDKLTAEEELKLNAVPHAKYLARQHSNWLESEVEQLQQRNQEQEAQIRKLLPRVAELEQFSRCTTISTVCSSTLLVLGGAAISCAGFFSADREKFLLLILGWMLLVGGLVVQVVSATFGWPPKN